MVTLFGLSVNIELIAVIVSLLMMIFQVAQKSVFWLFSITSAALYAVVYCNNALYVLFAMSLYNIGVSLYGLVQYILVKRGRREEGYTEKIQIRPLKRKMIIISIVIVCLLTCGLAIVNSYLDSPYPVNDAFIGVLSMLGIFYLSRQYIENWYVWLLCDSLSVVFYLYIGLYWSALLYSVYVATCFIGIKNWKKEGVKI